MNFLQKFFSSDGFMPHGHCYLWDPTVVRLHVISDGLIALAYLTIPITLIYIARKRKDLPFDWMFACFGIFILACGTTHALEIYTLWNPAYWLSGGMKAVTALASIATAILLVKLIPQLLAIPNTAVLRATNQALEKEVVERQRAETAIRDLQSKHALILHSISEGIHWIDKEGRIVFENPAAARMLGWNPGELIGQLAHAAILHTRANGNPYPFEECHLSESLRDGVTRRAEDELFWRKDGTSFPVAYSASPARSAAGEVVGAVIVFKDITERKRAAQAANKEQEFLAALIDNVTDGIISCDAEGTVTLVNRTLRELHGLPSGLITTDRWSEHFDLYLPGSETRMSGEEIPLARALRDGSVQDAELVIALKNGEVRHAVANGRAFSDAQGVLLGAVVAVHDVTVQRENERNLAASEELLREFIEHTPAAIAMMDTEMRYIQASERWLKDYHLENREIVGHSHYEIFPDVPQRWKEIHARVLAGAVESCEEDPFPRADGGMEWLQWEARPWRRPDGQIGGLVFYTQVITARKEAEEKIRFDEQRYRSLVEASSSIVWNTPATGRFETDQPGWSAFTGQTAEELSGWGWLDAVHPDDRHETGRVWSAAVESRSTYVMEHRIRAADQSYRDMQARATPILAEDGTLLQWIGVHQDITERRQVERELRQANIAAAQLEGAQRYTFLADTIPQIIWTARPDGRLDYCNKAWFEYTDLTLAQTKNQGWGAVLHPDDREPIVECWTQAFQNGNSFESECRIRRAADGIFRWHLNRGQPMRDEHGEIVQWVGTCTDIDDAKRSKQTLEEMNDELGLRVTERTAELHAAKEAAEGASRAKSEFLANMSHEIRTPMNGVIGMTGLLLNTPLSAQQQDFAETIQFSGEALLTVVNDILDFSKIEAGKLEFEIADLDLDEVVRGALGLLKATADSKGLELTAQIDDDTPRQLRGDSGRLRQVLVNLIGNAIKFTPEGAVEIRVSLDQQTATKACLLFQISDTGIGISPETQARLFQAFTQADGSTTRQYGGTGLGLAISKQLVEKMHGEIGVDSNAGRGSTFWFTVELQKSHESPTGAQKVAVSPPAIQRNGGPFRGKRILIAEDNAVNQRVAAAQLKKLGYAADCVANGLEVLEALTRISYEVILMDCQMPELDGYEATRRVRSSIGYQPYIIAMTAHAMQGDRELCLSCGMDDYITKPVRTAELEAALARSELPRPFPV